MMALPDVFAQLRSSTAAVAATEFAMAAPLLLTAGLWGLETANFAITNLQVSQAAMHIADHASRIGDTSTLTQRKIYESDVNELFLGINLQGGKSLDLFERGRVIVSSLEADPDSPSGSNYIHWQRCQGKKNYVSSYGTEGSGKGDESFAGMGPSGQEVIALEDEAVMFVEVSYDYKPIVTDALVSNKTITAISSFNVRTDRDLSEIYQRDPMAPDPVADCATYSPLAASKSFDPSATPPSTDPAGWDWTFD